MKEREACLFRSPEQKHMLKCHIFKGLEIKGEAECIKVQNGYFQLWKCVMEKVGRKELIRQAEKEQMSKQIQDICMSRAVEKGEE